MKYWYLYTPLKEGKKAEFVQCLKENQNKLSERYFEKLKQDDLSENELYDLINCAFNTWRYDYLAIFLSYYDKTCASFENALFLERIILKLWSQNYHIEDEKYDYDKMMGFYRVLHPYAPLINKPKVKHCQTTSDDGVTDEMTIRSRLISLLNVEPEDVNDEQFDLIKQELFPDDEELKSWLNVYQNETLLSKEPFPSLEAINKCIDIIHNK